MTYLLDTDWAIDVPAGRSTAVKLLRRLGSRGVYVSWVTAAEIYEAAYSSSNPEAQLVHFRHFLSAYRPICPSDPVLEWFGELRAGLRRRGSLIPNFDLLIAATAVTYDLTLLTRNTRHFERVPNLRLHQQAPEAG
ncbi:MAG TPA: type II toxin-antitoxin system VapC family toxin [Thermomicrobiales bacterium]|nr:type II toxin-antitoxin system VapC family toxin [Thermomicrobiales bacterium]